MTWHVHLANKKACWREFFELRGDLMFDDNGYEHTHRHTDVGWRNPDLEDDEARRGLIIDFGARSVSRRGEHHRVEADADKRDRYPRDLKFGDAITSLGEIRMNDHQELLVLGGLGRSGGSEPITSYAGADGWCDDISDGPVTCTVEVDGQVIRLKAWVIVSAPRFAPEIVNIVTLADVMEDVAIRHPAWKYRRGLYDHAAKAFDAGFRADFDRDIRPILERPAAYRWVANVPVLQSISPPAFDVRDPRPSREVAAAREAYVGLFRKANPDGRIDASHNHLFVTNDPGLTPGFPAMPLNAGNNPVTNAVGLIDKFLSVTSTQRFMLEQWARGEFTHSGDASGALPAPDETPWSVTYGSLGNCVGAPLCPGIEVTWTVCNARIYSGPFQIAHRAPEAYADGLSPARDETDPTLADTGCEPGDLTKRMAVPWQTDFFACSVQPIDFGDQDKNATDDIPAPPSYFAYWWPPQSPWQVISGDLQASQQAIAGTPAGMPVLFMRGVNTFSQTLQAWSYMGFVVNQTAGAHRETFPYFVERERNHDRFIPLATALGSAGDVQGGENVNFNPAWLLRESLVPAPSPAARIPTSRRHGRRP